MKKILLVILLAVFASVVSAESNPGCCLNPNANAQQSYCISISKESCCPDPAQDPGFYGAPGPTTQTQCEAEFFKEGQSCGLEAECATACCCQTNPNEAQIKKVGICEIEGISEIYEDFDSCEQGNSPCTFNLDPGEGSCTSPVLVVEAVPAQGEQRIDLSWSDSCEGASYEVQRCEVTDQGEPANCEILTTQNERDYVDAALDLLWDKIYEYKIVARKEGQEWESTRRANLGRVECWDATPGESFCIYPSNYLRHRDHIQQFNTHYGIGQSETKEQYLSALQAQSSSFEPRINNAYRCDEGNRLTEINTCEDTHVCVIDELGRSSCQERTSCLPDDLEQRPFGMFVTKESCHDLGYCYYETTQTVSDACFACDFQMECYDYKSRDSCETNRCGVGSGECEWRPTLDEFGEGVCVDPLDDNCEWCDKVGSTRLSTRAAQAYNTIFDVCTQQKADELSTALFACDFEPNDGTATQCSQMTCVDLDLSVCPAGDAEIINRANEYVLNEDDFPCALNVCRQHEGVCRKDANENGAPDCDIEDQACQRDHYRPQATLEPVFDPVDPLIITGYTISITDQISPLATISNPNARLFMCVSPAEDCRNTEGKDYTLSTADSALSINGLLLKEANTPNEITRLSEGENTLHFYARDSSFNLGLIDSVSFSATGSNIRPQIDVFELSGARLFEDVYYTNAIDPQARIHFEEPGARLRSTSQLTKPDETVILLSQWQVSPVSGIQDEFQIDFNTEFEEGEYVLQIDAENEIGRSARQLFTFRINRSEPLSLLSPFEQTISDPSRKTPFSISFDRPINLTRVWINGNDTSVHFSTDFAAGFSHEYLLDEGEYTLRIEGVDLFGNVAENETIFSVNHVRTPSLELVSPSFGVAPEAPFDIELRSDNVVHCRFVLDENWALDEAFNSMQDFDGATEALVHRKANFNEFSDDQIHRLMVWCRDPTWENEISRFNFDLQIDRSPPELEDVLFFPTSPVAYLPVNITVTAVANEPVQCGYFLSANEVDFSEMILFSEEFSENPQVGIEIDVAGMYPLQVQCQNRAERLSNVNESVFDVDPNQPLRIISHVNEFQRDGAVELNVETNKRATCSYSEFEDMVDKRSLGEPDQHIHKTLLPQSLEAGAHTFFVQCRRGSENPTLAIEVVIDDTPPGVDYLNDSSLVPDMPQVTKQVDRIFVKWNFSDNETGEQGLQYNYTVLEDGRLPTNWSTLTAAQENSVAQGIWITHTPNGPLRLRNNTLYRVWVTAGNVVGLFSTPLGSDGVRTDFSPDLTVSFVGPQFGKIHDNRFVLEVSTEVPTECFYNFNRPNEDIFSGMSRFDETGGTQHQTIEISIPQGLLRVEENLVFVQCLFDGEPTEKWRFSLFVDEQVPQIDAYAVPGNIVGVDEVTLKALAQEPIECRYSLSEDMANPIVFEEGVWTEQNLHEVDVLLPSTAQSEPWEEQFYVQCVDAVGLPSEVEEIVVLANRGAPLMITDRTRRVQAQTEIEIELLTNKRATCFLGLDPFDETHALYEHKITVQAQEGRQTIQVRCTAPGVDEVTQDIEILIDTTPPEVTLLSDTTVDADFPDVSASRNSMRIAFNATDNESGHLGLTYEYAIVQENETFIVNFTKTMEPFDEGRLITHDHEGRQLFLENGQTYFVLLRVTNALGHVSEVQKSDGLQINYFLFNIPPEFFPELYAPKNGVSQNATFNVTIKTNASLECKYQLASAAQNTLILLEYDRMLAFDEDDGFFHIADNVSVESADEIVVRCKDPVTPDIYTVIYALRVDKTPPSLTMSVVPSGPFADETAQTRVSLEADEEVRCNIRNATHEEFIRFAPSQEDFSKSQSDIITLAQGRHNITLLCENQAGLFRNVSREVVVDPTLSLTITDLTESLQGTSSPQIKIQTNAIAVCEYVSISGDPIALDHNFYEHTATLFNRESGVVSVPVTCVSLFEIASVTLTFTIDTTPPSIVFLNTTEDGSGVSPFTDKVFVHWSARDEESGSLGILFNYSLVEAFSSRVISNWTTTPAVNDGVFSGFIEHDNRGDDLNLTNGVRYVFKVRAINTMGLASEENRSTDFRVDSSRRVTTQTNNTCDNGVKDTTETDVDCGGECGICLNNATCRINADCRSGFCSRDSTCEEPSCDDGVRNGDETDVDCGGDCDKCENGKKCSRDDDNCESKNCKSNICREETTCNNNKLDPDETDVDCGGACDENCARGQQCDGNLDCELGLECERGACAVPDVEVSDDTDGDTLPNSWETRNGLDPEDASDALEDFDADGLTNADEYFHGTSPDKADTDGDGFSDKEEVDAGTDPTDPEDTPSSGGGLFLVFFVLLLLLLAGVLGYLLYMQYKQKQKKSAPAPRPMVQQRPVQRPPVQKQVVAPTPQPKKSQKKKRELPSFTSQKKEKQKEEKVEEKKDVSGYVDLSKKKEKVPDSFDKLENLIASKKKKIPRTKPMKKATVKQSKKVDEKLDEIEEKLSKIAKKKKSKKKKK